MWPMNLFQGGNVDYKCLVKFDAYIFFLYSSVKLVPEESKKNSPTCEMKVIRNSFV